MSQNIELLLKNSPKHWRAAYALSSELITDFYQQHPSKVLTPERLISFAKDIISQGQEGNYISRDTDISEVLAEESDQSIVEGIFHYSAKNYQALAGV